MLISPILLCLVSGLLFSTTYAADMDTSPACCATAGEAAASEPEHIPSLLSRLANGVSTQPYRTALDEMLRLSHTSITPSTPLDQAFWSHYADIKLKQDP